MPDLSVYDHGSIVVITPMTDSGRDWVEVHIPADAQWFGRGFVVEPRFVDDIVDGATYDGLEVA